MKRPMCFISLALLAAVIMIFALKPPSVYDDSSGEGEVTVTEGRVRSKFFKNDSFYLYLSDACTFKGDIRSEEKNSISVKLGKEMADFGDLPKAGSLCRVSGKKMLFARSSNPGQFDMGFYEMLHGLDYQIYDAEILGSGDSYDAVKEMLLDLRYKWSITYDRLFDADDAGVVRSMVLGDRNGLDDEIKGLYQRAGISHALCISGLHISLLGFGLYSLLKKMRLPRAPAAASSLLIMILYGMMTGMGTSTVRALTMFAIVLTGENIGRAYDILSSLSLACTVILLVSPLSIFDAGFMLSFGAVLGIGTVYPAVCTILPVRPKMLDGLFISLSVNLFTLPVMLYFFYQIPVYSLILNLILVPLMGVLLTLSIIAGLAGMLFLPLGAPAAFLAHIILLLYKQCCMLNDRLPFTAAVAGRPEVWKIVIYYLLLFAAAAAAGKCRKSRIAARVAAVLLIAAAVSVMFIRIRPQLKITMLDIGQGDCSFIQCRDGTGLLIDCGSTDVKDPARYRALPFIKSEGTGCIDYAVITHTDADHVNGLEELLQESDVQGMHIGCLIMPDIGKKDEEYIKITGMAQTKGIPVKLISTGDIINIGMLKISCLHPDRGYETEDKNEYSTVLDVSFGGFSALFTGDVQGEGEEQVTELLKHRYTLLKCAHHGSENSTPEEFLKKAGPLITFISCGKNNSYGHPNKALLERLKSCGTRIYITEYSGAVTVETDGSSIKTYTFF